MIFMESLSIMLSSAPPVQSLLKTPKLSSSLPPKSISTPQSFTSHQTQLITISKTPLQNHFFSFKGSPVLKTLTKPHISFAIISFFASLPCFASEAFVSSTEQDPEKINLESILLSIDDFLNRNPFFVAGCTFIWLVVLPITKQYLRKYKYIACIDAFRKLRDDPAAQLLDIRDEKSRAYLGSPNLTILKKGVVQVPFSEGDENGYVKKVLERLVDPRNTVVCVLDNFDGNSMKVAELLFKNGFKEAYAIRGGARGKKGWQEIQKALLPPSVHIYPKKKVKRARPVRNGGVNPKNVVDAEGSSSTDIFTIGSQTVTNGHVKNSVDSTQQRSIDYRSSSPYPNYPDLKPPSSPTPSKPRS